MHHAPAFAQGNLSYSGVVLSEMKGVYSSPDSLNWKVGSRAKELIQNTGTISTNERLSLCLPRTLSPNAAYRRDSWSDIES